MTVMRDRSGRSGRRRGSQKPGTAKALAGGTTVGGAGDGLCGNQVDAGVRVAGHLLAGLGVVHDGVHAT